VTNQKPELNTRNNKGLSVAIYLVISLPPTIFVTVNKSAARATVLSGGTRRFTLPTLRARAVALPRAH
jgi:hypothetical protein